MANLNKSQEKAVRANESISRLTRVECRVRVSVKETITPLAAGFVEYHRQATDDLGNVAFARVKLGPRGRVWDSHFDVVRASAPHTATFC